MDEFTANNTISGHIEAGWEGVGDAFAAVFGRGDELGASVAVTHKGRSVVEVWGGSANLAGDPWLEDTIVNVYSTTKTMTAIALMMCVDRGLVDVQAPVLSTGPSLRSTARNP